MSKRILVANWKNHPKSLPEAAQLLKQLGRKSTLFKSCLTFIVPPLPFLQEVSKRAKSFAYLGAQNVSLEEKGTHTGEVTGDILKSFGTKLVILGHSERRALGETDKIISEKVKVALRAGMIPLLCIGEKERDSDGEHFELLRQELRRSLEGLKKKDDVSRLMIAYEPVWAVGEKAKGALGAVDLSETVVFIKKVLTDIFDRKIADKIPILYGGSVDRDNIESLVKDGGVRGFLVGRASLKAESFALIAKHL